MDFANQLIFAVGLLFIVSILATVITPRLGVPLLLVFIVIGMLAGVDGPGHIHFADFHLANLAATAALVVILFDGGMRTSIKTFGVALMPALSLATVGVVLTTIIVGGFCTWLLDVPLVVGMLLGAIVSSTDAAAVFSLLHNKSVSLNQRVTSVLEIESGTNDPMAIFLTVGILTYLESGGQFSALQFLQLLIAQMGIGSALGVGGGWLLARAINKLELSDSLYPVFALFGGFMLYGLTALLGGSGFLAVYLAGLIIGNRPLRAIASIRRFHDGIAWMSQIGMFLMLGLLVAPHQLLSVGINGALIVLVLTLVARPLAVGFSLLPFHLPWREQLFISWVGLRGSVPIVLATFPWIAGVAHADLIFNITFFIVLASLVLQGASVSWSARMLDLLMPRMQTRIQRMDIDLPGQRGYEIVSYRLPESSAYLGRPTKELPVHDHSRIISLSRRGRLLPYREWGVLQAGDYISLLAAESDLEKLDAVFQSRRPRGKLPGAQQFFGEFAIAPDALARDLADTYNISLPEGAEDLSVAKLVMRFLPRPVTGDRLRLGAVELVVRSMEGRNIQAIGIRLPRE